MIIKIRDAGQERESEPMITQCAHNRIIKEKAHITHLVKLQRDNFQKLALDEGKHRLSLQNEVERLRNLSKGLLYLLGASMLGNIGMAVWQTL